MKIEFTAESLAKATPEELDLIDETARIVKALESPLELGLYVGMLEAFPHVRIYDKYYMALVEWRLYQSGIGPEAVSHEDGFRYHPETGERAIRKLKISVPVRHSKSLYFSVLAPTWHKLTYPNRPIMSVSSGDDFASRWSEGTRDLIKEHPEFGQSIDPAKKGAFTWRTVGSKAEFNAVGAGGAVSGKSAFGIHIDDVVKNMAQATSEAEMKTLVELYFSAIRKRLTVDFQNNYEPGYEVYIGTPYSKMDLGSQILAREKDDWYVLNLAALTGTELDENGVWIDPVTNRPDPLGRGANEALCPQIKTAEAHAEERASDPRTFAAMSMGSPRVDGGNLVQDFPEYRPLQTDDGLFYQLKMKDGSLKRVAADNLITFATVDLAMTKKQTSDWTVYSHWGVTPNRELLLLDCVRVKILQPEHQTFTDGQYRQRGGMGVYSQQDQMSSALSQAYETSYYLNTTTPFQILPKSKGDKTARFTVYAAPLFSSYRIFFNPESEIFNTLTEEVSDFPDVDHDDIVDTITLAGQKLPEIPVRKVTEELPPISEFWARFKKKEKYTGTPGGFSLGANVRRSLM